MQCPHCLGFIADDAVEPLYDLRTASELIPLRYTNLRQFLITNKVQYPARYRVVRTQSHRPSRVRMLYAREIKRIRGHYGLGSFDTGEHCDCQVCQHKKQKRTTAAA